MPKFAALNYIAMRTIPVFNNPSSGEGRVKLASCDYSRCKKKTFAILSAIILHLVYESVQTL